MVRIIVRRGAELAAAEDAVQEALLQAARRPARTSPEGRLVPLPRQDRSRWDTGLITEGVQVLQAALARDRVGGYQVQAAIAALHGRPDQRGDRLGADRPVV